MAARGARSGFSIRALAAVLLGTLIVVSAAVIWRRSVGVSTAREIQRLEAERSSLESERNSLENQLRRATSRQIIVEEATRRLGMHVATEGQLRFLQSQSMHDVVKGDSTR